MAVPSPTIQHLIVERVRRELIEMQNIDDPDSLYFSNYYNPLNGFSIKTITESAVRPVDEVDDALLPQVFFESGPSAIAERRVAQKYYSHFTMEFFVYVKAEEPGEAVTRINNYYQEIVSPAVTTGIDDADDLDAWQVRPDSTQLMQIGDDLDIESGSPLNTFTSFTGERKLTLTVSNVRDGATLAISGEDKAGNPVSETVTWTTNGRTTQTTTNKFARANLEITPTGWSVNDTLDVSVDFTPRQTFDDVYNAHLSSDLFMNLNRAQAYDVIRFMQIKNLSAVISDVENAFKLIAFTMNATKIDKTIDSTGTANPYYLTLQNEELVEAEFLSLIINQRDAGSNRRHLTVRLGFLCSKTEGGRV